MRSLRGGLLGGVAALTLSGAALASPPGFVRDGVQVTPVDDLATAGLGLAGLQGGAPAMSNPPTPEELRTRAIYENYRALVDQSAAGGFGVFYGPPAAPVPGVEYHGYLRGKGSDQNIAVLVQIPDGFGEGGVPCVVTGPSSGSRGVWGAIGTAGEWGHANGCAVVLTDKGTGTGAHDLSADEVYLIDGTVADADAAADASSFTAPERGRRLAGFVEDHPDRWAFKHAHSRRNPEADWGLHVIRSLEFARWAINEETGRDHGWDDLLVIGSSVSNGGGATLRAAERRPDLFDGVVVSEPNVNPVFDPGFVIQQGTDAPLAEHSRTLYDYTTLLNVYQGCANHAPENASAPFLFFGYDPVLDANRCAELADRGLVTGATLAEQGAAAQAIINDYGIPQEQNPVQPIQWAIDVPQGISITYANAYGRAGVEDSLCGYGFAAVGGDLAPAPLSAAGRDLLFSVSNGIPPTGGVALINEDAPGGPLLNRFSASPSSGALDQNLDGALCLRDLADGEGGTAGRIAGGIEQILADGDLGGVPTIIVQGRSDAILPVNHTGRPYFGLNQRVEGADSRLSYIEVLNAQHLDTLNGLPGFDTRYVPLHKYFIEAHDLMLDHLVGGEPLPESQVVRTAPRDPGQPLAPQNVPPIAIDAPPGDEITFDGSVLAIPD